MATRVKRRIDWPAAATALAARISHRKLHPAAMAAARADWRRTGRPARWALAFSGGADSLALLLILWAEGPGRWGRNLVALHFNHRLRGRAADADEKFCAQVCAALGVKFVAGRWAAARRDASEAEARAARFTFFEREMKRRKIRLLWLGHQQSDIAETMLMRLARGSGAGGLAAPRPAQARPDGRWHLRPLLTLKKTEIVAALRAAGAAWREDASNATGDFYRNRVRADVLPAWIAAAPNDALAGAGRSRELLEEDDAALEAWLDDLLGSGAGAELDLRLLAGKPRALWRRALHRWLAGVNASGEFSREGFEQLLEECLRGERRRMSAGANGFAKIEGDRLTFQRAAAQTGPWAEMILPLDGQLILPDGAQVGASRVALTAEQREQILRGAVSPGETAWLDAAKLGAAPLRVRPWRPGDRCQPLGAPGSAKLQDLFVNRKIPGDRRPALPVFVADAIGIVWVPELSPAERVKIDAQTNSAVQLTYHPGTSSVNR